MEWGLVACNHLTARVFRGNDAGDRPQTLNRALATADWFVPLSSCSSKAVASQASVVHCSLEGEPVWRR